MLGLSASYEYICYGSTASISFCAEIDFRRQILTSIDVRIWRLKSVPALKWSIVSEKLAEIQSYNMI